MGKKKIYETSKITSDSSLLQTSKQGAAVVSYRVQLHSFSSMCEHSQGTQGAPTTTKWQINANPNTPPPVKDFVPSKFSLHSLFWRPEQNQTSPNNPEIWCENEDLKAPPKSFNLLNNIFGNRTHWCCGSSRKQSHTSPLQHFQSCLFKCFKKTKSFLGCHASFPTLKEQNHVTETQTP